MKRKFTGHARRVLSTVTRFIRELFGLSSCVVSSVTVPSRFYRLRQYRCKLYGFTTLIRFSNQGSRLHPFGESAPVRQPIVSGRPAHKTRHGLSAVILLRIFTSLCLTEEPIKIVNTLYNLATASEKFSCPLPPANLLAKLFNYLYSTTVCQVCQEGIFIKQWRLPKI